MDDSRQAGFIELGMFGSRETLKETPEIHAPVSPMCWSASVKPGVEVSSTFLGIHRLPSWNTAVCVNGFIVLNISRYVGNSAE